MVRNLERFIGHVKEVVFYGNFIENEVQRDVHIRGMVDMDQKVDKGSIVRVILAYIVADD